VPDIEILYFAHAARVVGFERETIEAPEATTLREVQATILERHPGLGELAGSLLWAVDEKMAAADARVSPGQVVAVMPPFSGG
jgi:molybdopterin converting factor small subunit